MQEKLLIDLKSNFCYFGAPNQGATNEYRQNNFFSNPGIPTSIRISQMCRALSRRLQSQKFFMHGSIFMPGFCSINLSRKFTRYRIVSDVHAKQTLSYGLSQSNIQK